MCGIDQWVGKLAVVTGASSGIGAAIAKKLVESGVNVVGLARRVEKIHDASKSLNSQKAKLFGVECDITDEEDVVKAMKEIEKIGPIYILINNAGVSSYSNLHDGDLKDWKKVLDTNLLGTCLLSRETIKRMTFHKIQGQIININSILGHFVYTIPKASMYIASKHALTAATESLRLELISEGSKIKISSLSPGPVDETEFFVKTAIGADKGEGPIKYFLKPEDIVNAIMYMLSVPSHLHVAELMLRPVGEPL